MGTYAYTQSDTQLIPSTKTYTHPTPDKTPLLLGHVQNKYRGRVWWRVEILDNHLIFGISPKLLLYKRCDY
jgi:hypothetical protein